MPNSLVYSLRVCRFHIYYSKGPHFVINVLRIWNLKMFYSAFKLMWEVTPYYSVLVLHSKQKLCKSYYIAGTCQDILFLLRLTMNEKNMLTPALKALAISLPA